MAIQEGYSRYACDVQSCRSATYALPETDEADSYVIRRRIDASGVERKLLLCPSHAAIYTEIVKACDELYTAFERTGKVQIITKADLDAASTALAEMTAKYEERRNAAKWWSDKHAALQAEFDAYKKTHPDTSVEGGA